VAIKSDIIAIGKQRTVANKKEPGFISKVPIAGEVFEHPTTSFYTL